jgi:hypothetical protein
LLGALLAFVTGAVVLGQIYGLPDESWGLSFVLITFLLVPRVLAVAAPLGFVGIALGIVAYVRLLGAGRLAGRIIAVIGILLCIFAPLVLAADLHWNKHRADSKLPTAAEERRRDEVYTAGKDVDDLILSCQNYAFEHGGLYPLDLQTLATAFRDRDPTLGTQITRYTYYGAGVIDKSGAATYDREEDLLGEDIIVLVRKEPLTDGTRVFGVRGFGVGRSHASFAPSGDFEERIRRANVARAKLRLAPIDLNPATHGS